MERGCHRTLELRCPTQKRALNNRIPIFVLFSMGGGAVDALTGIGFRSSPCDHTTSNNKLSAHTLALALPIL